MTEIGLGQGGSGETGKDPHLGFLSLHSPALFTQGSEVRLEAGYRGRAAMRLGRDRQTQVLRGETGLSHWHSS